MCSSYRHLVTAGCMRLLIGDTAISSQFYCLLSKVKELLVELEPVELIPSVLWLCMGMAVT